MSERPVPRALVVAVAIAGLVAVFYIARAIAFAVTGFDPEEAALDSDCDQCTLTETLDLLPWISMVCLAYLALVIAVAAISRRRARKRRDTVPVRP